MPAVFPRALSFPLMVAVALAPMVVQAASPQPEPHGEWEGQGELGLALSSGNTDSSNAVGKLAFAREYQDWKHDLGLSFQYGENDGKESAYRYEIFGKSGGRLTDTSYLSGALRHQRDHFATNEYQWTVSMSYGREVIKREDTHLTFELGPGYRLAKLQDVRVHRNEAIVRGSIDFGHQLTDTTKVYDTLLVEAGKKNTYARNQLGLQVAMSEALALKAGLEVRYNSDVLPGIENTDTLTTLNVVYGF